MSERLDKDGFPIHEDHEYYDEPSPWRRPRRWLGIGVVLVVALVAWGALASPAWWRNGRVYLSDKVCQKARRQIAQNRPNDAEKTIRIARWLAGQATAEVHYTDGLRLHQQGDLEEAHHALSQALELDEGHLDALAARGRVRFAAGQPEQAIEDLQRVLEQQSDHADAHFLLARCLVVLERLEEALAHFDQLDAIDPDRAERFQQLRARCLVKLGRSEEAIKLINEYLSGPLETGQFLEGYQVRAAIYRELELHDEALADYTRALELKPEDFRVRLKRTELLVELGRDEEVLDGLETDEEIIQARFIRASVYEQRGKYRESVTDYTRIVQVLPANHPERHRALNNRAYTRALGRIELDKALDDVQQALKADHTRAEYWDTRGYLLYLRGEMASAMADYNQSLHMAKLAGYSSNSLGEIYLHRGLVYEAIGNSQQAEADYERAQAAGIDVPEMKARKRRTSNKQ